MKLYFENSWGVRRLIGEPETRLGANKMVHDFCKARDFEVYYVRNWVEDGELFYDIGSHSEFFVLLPYEGELLEPNI